MDSIRVNFKTPQRLDANKLHLYHLWAISHHMVELFKIIIPEEDNHVTLALSSKALTEVLSSIDPDHEWEFWTSDANET